MPRRAREVPVTVMASPAEPAADGSAATRVLLVARTRTRLRALARLLEDPGFVVSGQARDADEAEQIVRTAAVDVLLLDLDLHQGGLEVIEQIMATRATPIVVYRAAAEHAATALAAGAVDLIDVAADVNSPQHAVAVRKHLAVAARAPVITHPRARLRGRAAPVRRPVVTIGASTGGPPALATVLGSLPEDLDAVVLVVQHMADGFVEGLARWLDGVCPLPVRVAVDGERAIPGCVYLAPFGANLELHPGMRLHLTAPASTQFHVPSVDTTLISVAEVCGPRSVGVLLTGMGRDGVNGMAALTNHGAHTIAQDEATAVVWGMPGAAATAGFVAEVVALEQVADAIRLALAQLEAVNR